MQNFVHNHVAIENQLKEVTIDGKRFYETPGGIFPSVTTVVGWEKQQFFSEWRKNNPEESRRVTSRGTKFHSLIESYLNNEILDFENMMPNFKFLFNQLQPEIDKINNILAIETPLWSKTLGLAGRTDCIAEYDGKLSIIDFKASSKEKRKSDIENYFLQASAYALMFQERTGIIVDNYAILISCEDGLRQVFEGRPITHVKKLKQTIEKYRKLNAIPRTENA